MRKEFNFTIGADPEFNLIMQGRRINARSTLLNILGKNKDFVQDREGMGYETGKEGNIGWDGHDSTGEIRPTPAKTADELVNNLGEIFNKFTGACPLFDMSTLSYFGSVGGHIHFSVPEQYRTEQKIANLHKKMASLYLPVLMSENKLNLQIRTKGGYGKLGDFRSQSYDHRTSQINGYEFRSPSAEWLTTKKIALATLAYAGTIYNEVINHPDKIKKMSDIFFKTEKQAEALQMLAMSDYESLTIGLFKRIKKEIKKFEFYPEYKDEIEYILDTDQVIKDKQRAAYNILNGWGMRDTIDNPTKKDLLSNKKISKKLEKINMDMMNSLVNITYNNDVNVELFKKAIIERTAVYNWRLKNSYYLFGTKKGLDDYLVFDDQDTMYKGMEGMKTNKDKECIESLYYKMKDKFLCSNDGVFRTGNREIQMMIAGIDPEKEAMKKIFIGIPYEDRLKQKVKDFIKIIYDTENKKNTGIKIKDIKVLEPMITVNKDGTRTMVEKERGKITEVFGGPESDIVFDVNNRNPIADLRNMVEDIESVRIRTNS